MPGGIPTKQEHQCQALRKGIRQCRKWALKGSKYCQFHGGRRSSGKSVPKIEKLPVFYKRHLNKTLTEAVSEQLGMDPADQLNLFTELAIVRELAGDALKLHDKAQSKLVGDEVRTMANALVLDSLRQVQSMCEAAARVENSRSDKFSIHSLKAVINQLIRIMHRVCGDEHQELAEEFERLVREEVKMPQEGVLGTTVTPDQDVAEMDDAVPRA